ncbi:ImmA/IrrE family metallo-endopeptidase [Miniphocaeibacter massiliensis]|uniref:ImmA/IrrE family metallo-endopeptidase n=1 Tax=Miniphocaeibacter massiliensis TaxID=2041841 RepID=UPI000C1C159F|nr:ImmA/IrrE family metallo-endopeptidase [Miniphocaeibacter massiliensis]
MGLVYESLISQFSKEVHIIEKPLLKAKGYYIDGTIFINSKITEKEKIETLLEEWGHYKTTKGNILEQKCVCNSKQEQQAMDYAVKKFIPVKEIRKAFDRASIEKNDYEIAENLNITTYMLKEAYKYYMRKKRK